MILYLEIVANFVNQFSFLLKPVIKRCIDILNFPDLRQRTIFEYHRIEINMSQVVNNSAIIITPLPSKLPLHTYSAFELLNTYGYLIKFKKIIFTAMR